MQPSDPRAPAPPAAPFNLPRTFTVVGALAAVTLVAHFLYLAQFGLYEDDYFYTLPVFGWDWATWWSQVQNAILHPIQGRPLNHAVRRTLFFLTLNHGGLESAYLFSWAMITANAALVFNFVRRILSRRAAIGAALVFIVYPLDTSRQMLMHQSDLHFGAFLLLAALNLYAGGRRVTALFVAGLGLLNYESFYLPFLAAPLLVATRVRPSWRALVIHGALFFGLAGGVLFARRLLGESRAAEMVGSLGDVAGRMLTGGPIGVWQGLKAMVLRPADALLHSAPYAWMIGLGVALLSTWLITRPEAPAPTTGVERTRASVGWVAVGAVLAWLISYLLSFREGYYPPIVTIGRLTGIHAPATFGAAMFVAVLVEFAGGLRWGPIRAALAVALGGLIGFSASFGLEVQRSEYAAHWTKQAEFYRRLAELTGDLQEGEVVVLDGEGDAGALPITQGFPRFGTVNYTPLAFTKYLNWPAAWGAAPQIAVLWNECPVQPVDHGLALFTPPWRFPQPAGVVELPKDIPVLRDGKFIYLAVVDGSLQRLSGPVSIHGHTLNARAPATDQNQSIRLSPIFNQLTGNVRTDSWFTLRDARNYPH